MKFRPISFPFPLFPFLVGTACMGNRDHFGGAHVRLGEDQPQLDVFVWYFPAEVPLGAKP